MRRLPGLGLLLLFCSCLIACTHLPGVSNQPVSSENDPRQYRYLELPNQLKVLLVSDPRTDKSAASLDVYAGSRDDPQDYQGLAHFLEHMLFLGTAKYPEAGEYQRFINAHNGDHNAYTAFEHTNYFFDIDPDYLEPALDRFAQFFIAPLFSEDYVEREKNAVHSEYSSKLKDDYRKSLDVFRSQLNSEHPYAKLAVGNLQTLSDDGRGALQAQLRQFYQRHYSANTMGLVVLGKNSLDELEQMVSDRFAAVANRTVERRPVEQPLFAADTLPRVVSMRPEKDYRELSLIFPVPDPQPYYRHKPLDLIGHVLGHEGAGSLLSYLKAQGWAESLSAGTGLRYSGGATFNVTIRLTEAGERERDRIIAAVFTLLDKLRAAKDLQWLFEEQKNLAQARFRYQEPGSAMRYSSMLAANLHDYPVADILRADYMMDSYDADLLAQFLAFLRPDNVLVALTSPAARVDNKTHWYATDYSAQAASAQQLAAWRLPQGEAVVQLPQVNEFVATDFSLYQQPVSADAAGGPPQLLIDQPSFRLWYRADERFGVPKASVYFSLRSPLAQRGSREAAMLQLLAGVLTEQLNEYAYPAMLAGLDFSVRAHARGLSVRINGYHDKQRVLLDKILAAIAAAEFSPSHFEQVKTQLIRRAENASKQQPYRMLFDDLSEILNIGQWSERALLAEYAHISLDGLQQFAADLNAALDYQVLVYGNYSPDQARSLGANIRSALAPAGQAQSLPAMRVLELAAGERIHSVDSIYPDAALLLYLQAPAIDRLQRAVMGMAAQMMRSDFYTQLRTEKQLGYVVTSGAYPLYDVPGMYFLVQSPVLDTQGLYREILAFVDQRLLWLEQLDEAVFERHQRALIARLQEQPKSSAEQAEFYWRDIAYGYYQFDSQALLIEAIAALRFEQWRAALREIWQPQNRRALWLAVPADGRLERSGLISVGELERYQSGRPYYQFP